jgi:hypothetical protein
MRRKRALKVVLVVVGVIFCGLASLNYDVCEARAWVGDETGAPVGVQQKLMRHAHVSTTMDQHGNASALAKRKANRPIV